MKVLISKKSPTITISQKNGVIESTSPFSLHSGVSSGGVKRLSNLEDVVEIDKLNGSVLVYDSATDNFILSKLEGKNIIGDIDGGDF